MKRAYLLFVGLLCLSVAVVAGEVITNDTGEDATGLRVMFSAPVLITAFGDILMSVDPQMLSFEFVFSGGSVKPWDSHWFNYAPATANVMEIEWLTGSVTSDIPQGNLTREDLMNLGRPPTYEEIMSVIAEYPGPDEPLYEPAPDEPIWLTDLEGHADIYDNDSIRINCADWFDQSQLTGIDVYRNGIQLEFLPDEISVLTNEQMKTFVGSRSENSPASEHTDHTILGYEYGFRIETNDGGSETILSSIIKNPIKYTGDAFIHIDQIWPWTFPQTSDEVLRTELRRLRSMGFVGIGLDTYFYMNSEYSSEVFPDYERDNDLHWTITPDEDLLRRVLRLAEEEGLVTWLRVQVWVAEEYKETVSHFVWRGSIEPRSVSQWFESYTAACLDVARIAEQEGVETLTIGVELLSMRKHVAEWEQMVARIRSVFGGMVTYDEATHHPLVGPICEGENFAQVAGPHWESFDRIEMNYWQNQNCLPLDTQIDQRFSLMVERFAEFWMPAFRYYRSTYPSKPIAYGELGHFICDGTVVEGWWSGDGGPTDYQEAADVWATYLIAAEFFETSASSVWSWFLNDPEPPKCDLVNIRDTPASQVVASFIADESINKEPNSPSLISAAVAKETQLSNLIIDLSTVPWMESYSQSAAPSKLFTEQGQRPVSEGTNWGLPGGDVKGIKVHATEQGSYIYWETYGQNIGESYAYLMHLRPPGRHETVAIILIDPATGLARFDLAIGDVWHALPSRIEVVEVTANAVTAFIPDFELPSGDLATDFPGWEPVALLVWAMETPEQETYEFPHTNVLR